jgi:hypothetical protein
MVGSHLIAGFGDGSFVPSPWSRLASIDFGFSLSPSLGLELMTTHTHTKANACLVVQDLSIHFWPLVIRHDSVFRF